MSRNQQMPCQREPEVLLAVLSIELLKRQNIRAQRVCSRESIFTFFNINWREVVS
jgi:hypothetical protein